MKQQQAVFRYARSKPPNWLVRFDLTQPPTAGRYVLADLGEPIRTVLFPTEIDDSGFTALVPRGHPATKILPGTAIDVFGPLGHGFNVSGIARLLLIADAANWPLLKPLLTAAPAVAVVIEATTRLQLPAITEFPASVELLLVTRDGSAGYLGPLDEDGDTPKGLERAAPLVRELLTWAERVCIAADRRRYAELADFIAQTRFNVLPGFAQAIIQVPMPCGVGACELCRVPTRNGEKLACTDGPVFNLADLAVR